MNENLSPADISAVVGNTDRNNGFGYAYPVFPYGAGFGGGYGNTGYGGDWIWLILILALFGGFGGNGFGGYAGGYGFQDFAWLSNGQKEIMQNTNTGFDTLHLSNQIEGVRDGIYGLSNQLCNCCADMNQTVSNGFYNAEISASNRQMANMQQAFNNQLSTVQGFNGVQSQLADCCCENRLATQDLKSTVISENCSDREVLRQIGQDILVNQTANTQKIIDEIFRDRLDEKDSKIADLQRELQMANLKESQIEQTAQIQAGFVQANKDLYNLLDSCPVRHNTCLSEELQYSLVQTTMVADVETLLAVH